MFIEGFFCARTNKVGTRGHGALLTTVGFVQCVYAQKIFQIVLSLGQGPTLLYACKALNTYGMLKQSR